MSTVVRASHGRRTPSGAAADALLRVSATGGAVLLVLALTVMAAILVDAALPAMGALGAGRWATGPNAVWPPLVGTLVSAIIALLLAVPLSLAVALFVTEFAPEPIARRAALALDALGAVPTLVFGMWGMSVFLPWLGAHSVNPRGNGALITENGGVLPAGLVLAVMLLPSVSSMAARMFAAVPTSLREAAIAVGATRWEVVRFVVLPHVRAGIAGAVVLGLGRAMGEAMAVVLLIGNRPTSSELPSSTVATTLVTELRPGIPESHVSTLALLALCLFVLTIAVRAVGQLLVGRMSTTGGSP